MEPGRYGVVELRGFGARLIRLVTRSWATHAFIVIDSDGTIIESWASVGVRIGHISQYAGMRIAYSTDEMTDEQRAAVIAFAKSLIGTPYDFVSFACFGLAFLGIPTAWIVSHNPMRNAMICSRLVVAAGKRAGLDWAGGIMEALVTPAHLAARLEMRPA